MPQNKFSLLFVLLCFVSSLSRCLPLGGFHYCLFVWMNKCFVDVLVLETVSLTILDITVRFLQLLSMAGYPTHYPVGILFAGISTFSPLNHIRIISSTFIRLQQCRDVLNCSLLFVKFRIFVSSRQKWELMTSEQRIYSIMTISDVHLHVSLPYSDFYQNFAFARYRWYALFVYTPF